MTQFPKSLLVLALCGTALMACSTMPEPAAKAQADTAKQKAADATLTAPTDLDGAVRQAQLFRLATRYDEAVHILSQLMLVASDDPRVVGEYGKTLTDMGRAQDATQFLSRAVELQGNDWTLYSALGVAYDEIGDQNSARAAYEHALALQPAEPSVLSNYALSRMLAHDPQGAHDLIERARVAGGQTDRKIARNIALLKEMAPGTAPDNPASAVSKPVPKAAPAPKQVAAAPQPQSAPPRVAVSTPRSLKPVDAQPLPPAAPTVVMQKVPVDPLAGPVAPRPARKLAKIGIPAAPELKPTIAAKPEEAPVVQKVAVDAVAAKPRPVVKTIVKAALPATPELKPTMVDAKPDEAPKPVVKAPANAAEPKSKSTVPSLRTASAGY